MVRTLFSDHTRLAAGAIVGAVTAALFVEGILAGPQARSGPDDRSTVGEGIMSAPEPLPAVVESHPATSSTAIPTTTTTIITTTTSKRSSTTITTTTTAVPPATTTTTVRPTTTTTTTTRTCRILC